MTGFQRTGAHAVATWLDPHEAFVSSLDDREFLAHLPSVLALLDRPGPVAEILDELRTAERHRVAAFMALQQRTAQLAEDWVERWEMHATGMRVCFEQIRGQIQRLRPVEPQLTPPGHLHATPVRRALHDLDSAAIDAVGKGHAAKAQLDAFREATHAFHHAERAFDLSFRTAPEFSLTRLDELALLVNPPESERTDAHTMPRALGVGGVLDAMVFLDPGDQPIPDTVSDLIALARKDLQRVVLEVRRRLDLTRTRLSVVRRFATWAAWYGRTDLRELAEAHPGQVEERLTARLAAFLFEHGHTPLSKPLVGRLEPDLLDASALEPLYVEAKQYQDPAGAKRTVAQGARQALDTAALLLGTPLALEEAFVVVFALAGPRLDVPAEIRAGHLTIHLIVIDLVPWEQVGSRRRINPIRITESDLLSEIDEPGEPAPPQ